MEEQIIMAEFKQLADARKKSDGMVSRQAIVESLEQLCIKRCMKIKNSNPAQFTDSKLVNEVNLVCRTMQKMFQFPDDLITQLILPNVRASFRNM